MKKAILLSITILAMMSCRKIETDGEKEIVIVTQNVVQTGPVAKTITLSGQITKDTTLLAKDINYLQGIVYVMNGATLTVEAGAKVQGKYSGSDVSALVVTRGGKIVAKGNADAPIVFTSASANPQSGDWGGIVLLGKAPINTSATVTGASVSGLLLVEGGLDATLGLAGSGDAVAPSPVPNDNSGILSYVRIEYAGYAFQPDKELNSLTMAAVGSGTQIDHVQVSYGKDDAFEWFGGSVNCKYLIAFKTLDDDFDTDNGFSGKVQFGIILRDSTAADISKSEGFESDNNSGGTQTTLKTNAVFSNITAIGPRATLDNKGNSLFLAGAQIRRNSSISIFNSVFLGWPTAILIDATTGTPVDKNIADSSLRIRYSTLAGNTVNLKYAASASAPTGATDASILAWFSNAYNGNTILTKADESKLIAPFNYTSPDFTPYANNASGTFAGSVGVIGHLSYQSNGNFTDPLLQDAYFKKVTFRGAVGLSGEDGSWWKGWTKWNY